MPVHDLYAYTVFPDCQANHIRLLVDEDVLKGENVGCHPCVNTSSLKIKTKDVFDTFLKSVGHDMTVVHLTGE